MLTYIILALLFLIFIYQLFNKTPEGLPPGEWGWPIIGKMPAKGTPFRQFYRNLRDKHGDIFTHKVGERIFIVLTDYHLIKTALNQLELTGRPDFYSFRFFSFFKNHGIIGSENQVWQDSRRFALLHLRDLGMGKSRLEDTISVEVDTLIQELDKHLDKPTELSWIINVAVLNVIWGLVASKRYDINDEDIKEFASMINTNFELLDGPVRLLDFFPSLNKWIPDFIKTPVFKMEPLFRSRDKFDSYVKEIVTTHKKEIQSRDPQDLVDFYLTEVENKKGDENEETFKEDLENLLVIISDLFAAGSETTSSSIRWFCLFMAKYPEVQRKIQQEIDEVVPSDSQPQLEHKNKLHYYEATNLEIQRFVSLTPAGVPHAALVDTSLKGYKIPKGAVILPFQEMVHRDPKYWTDPETFDPSHFLDQDGKVITKKDGFLPFSVGRRQCLGESLAKMELFLFMTNILHRYTICPVPGKKMEVEFDQDNLIFNAIKPFEVILKRRH